MVSMVIHSNPRLLNQIESSQWLQQGFKRHGINAEITADKKKEADIHVIQGPWYAFNEWLPQATGENVLFLDRCFYGDARYDLSIGWLQPDGSRNFCNDGTTRPNGNLPTLKRRKDARRCAVIFEDFGADTSELIVEARLHYASVFYRPHPAQQKSAGAMALTCELSSVWEIADVAIGHSSSVLVDAEINGLHVESSDPRHVVHPAKQDRAQWLQDLSWAQWNHKQLIKGEFWEHLC